MRYQLNECCKMIGCCTPLVFLVLLLMTFIAASHVDGCKPSFWQDQLLAPYSARLKGQPNNPVVNAVLGNPH